VPEDLSIVGFNDLEFAATAFPRLTTVATPRYEMGSRAGEIVLEIIRGTGARPSDRRLDLGFKVIVRESTRAAKPDKA
jgi:LacI family gluconate utilization system Gnt-I transcriptional repressor